MQLNRVIQLVEKYMTRTHPVVLIYLFINSIQSPYKYWQGFIDAVGKSCSYDAHTILKATKYYQLSCLSRIFSVRFSNGRERNVQNGEARFFEILVMNKIYIIYLKYFSEHVVKQDRRTDTNSLFKDRRANFNTNCCFHPSIFKFINRIQ